MTARPDPISEGWLARGAPMDLIDSTSKTCPVCLGETEQDRYRVILGRYGGVGAPFFLKPFLRRSSTAGKVGRKSVWDLCVQCGSFLPHDSTAKEDAAALGLPNGFLNTK